MARKFKFTILSFFMKFDFLDRIWDFLTVWDTFLDVSNANGRHRKTKQKGERGWENDWKVNKRWAKREAASISNLNLWRFSHKHLHMFHIPIQQQAHSVWKSPKVSHLIFSIFVLSGNTVWPQASGFQKRPFFGIFNELLASQNVNVARFARDVEWDFLPWY